VNRLDSRRLEVELDQIERELPFAPDAEKTTLMRRVDALTRQLKKLNPARWNMRRTGGRSAR
jgi:hypothetical protein